MTSEEEALVLELRQARLIPASWAKRFIRDLHDRYVGHDAEPLTEKQVKALWSVAYTYRRQLTAGMRARVHDRHERETGKAEADAVTKGLPRAACPLEQAFRDALAESPTDGDARLIYADWLEEQRRQLEADCQRWIAQGRYAPILIDLLRPSCRWLRKPRAVELYAFPAEIPETVFCALPGGFSDTEDTHRYLSVLLAMQALESAWLHVHAKEPARS